MLSFDILNRHGLDLKKQNKPNDISFPGLPGCFKQAIERGPAQLNAAEDEQGEASEAAQQSVSEVDNMEVRGSRFSKSAEERQSMLKQRKEEMLQQARRFVHGLKVSSRENLC